MLDTEEHIKNVVPLEGRKMADVSRTIYNIPTSKQLDGHDCYPEVIKAVILLWETSRRVKFAQLSDILINDKSEEHVEMLQKNTDTIKSKILNENVTCKDMEKIISNFIDKLEIKENLLLVVHAVKELLIYYIKRFQLKVN